LDCPPELPPENGFLAVDKAPFHALARRAEGIQLAIVLFVIERTTSAVRRPEYAHIPIGDYVALTGKTPRMVYEAIAELQGKGFIKRDGRGGIKACPENFAAAPLPAARKCKRRPLVASVEAPAAAAALRVTDRTLPHEGGAVEPAAAPLFAGVEPVAAVKLTSVEPAGDQVERPAEAIISTTVPAEPLVKLTSLPTEPDCQKAETYCPWNWRCSHLSTGSGAVSIETEKHTITTTTEPTGDRAEREAAALETAYLARFLQPASRIGEALGVDDEAAGRMWREASAVNCALTPRDFLSIGRMKENEWSRQSDNRPGLKVKSRVGLLVTSMPAAVQGALYMQAREQAADELASDLCEAREILAKRPPRDRAWAMAILAEADGYDTRQTADGKTIAAIAARYSSACATNTAKP
jgi:hypothetical protein